MTNAADKENPRLKHIITTLFLDVNYKRIINTNEISF